MNLVKVIFLISLGGLIESGSAGGSRFDAWAASAFVSGFLWGWSTLLFGARKFYGQLMPRLTGRPAALPATDPQALAAEITSLNAQIAHLRDTATSFDVSFDETLHRMDERLRRVEQQSPFVQVRRS